MKNSWICYKRNQHSCRGFFNYYFEQQTACIIKFGPTFSKREMKWGKPHYHPSSLPELTPMFLFPFTCPFKISVSLFLQLWYFKLELFLSKHPISQPPGKKIVATDCACPPARAHHRVSLPCSCAGGTRPQQRHHIALGLHWPQDICCSPCKIKMS